MIFLALGAWWNAGKPNWDPRPQGCTNALCQLTRACEAPGVASPPLGNSTRLVAGKLGISAETVKLHRKHAYAKLDISSQAELLYLFVDALASHMGNSGADPLASYHHQSSRVSPYDQR